MAMDERNPTEPTENEAKSTTDDPTQPAEETAKTDPAVTREQEPEQRPRRRGFAAMDRDRVREIASRGGRAAHAAGTAHQFSSDEARIAGKKGGEAPHVRRGGVRRRPQSEPAAQPSGEQNHDDRR